MIKPQLEGWLTTLNNILDSVDEIQFNCPPNQHTDPAIHRMTHAQSIRDFVSTLEHEITEYIMDIDPMDEDPADTYTSDEEESGMSDNPLKKTRRLESSFI